MSSDVRLCPLNYLGVKNDALIGRDSSKQVMKFLFTDQLDPNNFGLVRVLFESRGLWLLLKLAGGRNSGSEKEEPFVHLGKIYKEDLLFDTLRFPHFTKSSSSRIV